MLVSRVTKGVFGILSMGLSESEERSMIVLAFDDGFFGNTCSIDGDRIG